MYSNEQKAVLSQMEVYAEENFIPIMKKESLSVLIKKVKETNPKEVLEIGTAIGYSTAHILINSEAKVYTIEIDEERTKEAKKNLEKLGLIERTVFFSGDVKNILPLAEGSYDFILLDGPKSCYPLLLENSLRLLKDGGILFCDDVKHSEVKEGKIGAKHRSISRNINRFIDILKSDKRLKTEFYGGGDGCAVAVKLSGDIND